MSQFWDSEHKWQPHLEIWGAAVHHQESGCQGYPNLALHLADMPPSIGVDATAAMHRSGHHPAEGPAIDMVTPRKYEQRSYTNQPHASYLLVEHVLRQMGSPSNVARVVARAVYPTVGTYARGNDDPLVLVRRIDIRLVVGVLPIKREEPIRKACVSILMAVHHAVGAVL